MNSKQLVFLPLLVLGLASCTPNTNPKSLSFDDAISYINKNSKGRPTTCTGYVTYNCKDTPETVLDNILKEFGVTDTSKIQGGNEIQQDKIGDYLRDSDGSYSAHDKVHLSLMYLNETNFTKFVKDQPNFSYTLTYVKEFVMDHQFSKDLTYTRYYDSNLRLYKFEIHSSVVGQEYDVTQIFNSSI